MGNQYNFKHGQYNTRLYNIWKHMKSRCNNPKDAKYANYGGRGIKVCEEWVYFTGFYKWSMSNGYEDNLEIDRIDNDGDYEPGNCRWTTRKVQCNNFGKNHLLTYEGVTHTLQEWSEILGVNKSTMSTRAWRGWSTEEILFGRDKNV